jgi:hypothetical protein
MMSNRRREKAELVSSNFSIPLIGGSSHWQNVATCTIWLYPSAVALGGGGIFIFSYPWLLLPAFLAAKEGEGRDDSRYTCCK